MSTFASRSATTTDDHDAGKAKPSRTKLVLFALALVLIAAIVGAVAAEIGVRWIRPQAELRTPTGLYQPDPPGRFRLTPGFRGRFENRTEFDHFVEINSAGLRGAEVGPRVAGTTRILVVGDSFTFGVGVDEPALFLRRAESTLRADGRAVELLNGGLPSFGVVDEASWLERHGLAFAPDVVVVAIFLGNDIQDAPDAAAPPKLDGGLLATDQGRGPLRWLQHHSHLFVLAKRAVPPVLQSRVRAALGMPEAFAIRMLRKELEVYRTDAPEWIDDAVRLTARALDRLIELGRQHHVQVAAVLIPSEMQVREELFEMNLRRLGLQEDDYDASRPRMIFNRLLIERSIPTLDLTETFREAVAGGRLVYFRNDRHWTPDGHALAGQQLARFLVESALSTDSP